MNVLPDESDSDTEQQQPKRVKRFVEPTPIFNYWKEIIPGQDMKLNEEAQEDQTTSSNEDSSKYDELLLEQPLPQVTKTAELTGNSLSKSILDPNSVGFKMMQKMGFKANDHLGSVNNPYALSEPVPLTRRKARSGLLESKNHRVTLQRFTAASSTHYRNSAREALKERRAKATIVKLQKFCLKESSDDTFLLNGGNIEEINFLWREYAQRLNNRDSCENPEVPVREQPTQEKLAQLLNHARLQFYYCPYCGVKYDNSADLAAQCPGISEEVHSL